MDFPRNFLLNSGEELKMKKEFSVSWKGSSQVRKQLSANLKKELRKKYGKRNFPLRKDDEVKVMRGKFKGSSGKISVVDLKKQKVAVEGIQRKRKDGTKINFFFDASNLQIQSLALDDKKRIKAISRKATEKKEKNDDKISKNKK